jgi:phage-related protein (TIGR01555 family)
MNYNGISSRYCNTKCTINGASLSILQQALYGGCGYLTLNRFALSWLYVKDWVVKKTIDLPPRVALKEIPTFDSTKLNEDNLQEVDAFFKKHKLLEKVIHLNTITRLYGGGAIIIDINDATKDLEQMDASQPLTKEDVINAKSIEFVVADLWELTTLNLKVDRRNVIDLDYNDTEFYYYGKKIHRSRLILLKGQEAPAYLRGSFKGWGLSVLENLTDPLKGYLLSSNVMLELQNEARISILKMDKLETAVATNTINEVEQKLDYIQKNRDIHSAILLSNEDEFQQQQLNLKGMRETPDYYCEQMAAAANIPYKYFFGSSPNRAGLGGENESDQDANFGLLIDFITHKNIPVYNALFNLATLNLFGIADDEVNIEFTQAQHLSPEQKEQAKTNTVNNIQTVQMINPAILSTDEIISILNQAEVFPIQIEEKGVTTENIVSTEAIDDNNASSGVLDKILNKIKNKE